MSCTAQKVIAVAGPTASGKSALALHLAKELGAEIVSCDSMQIYRGMNIGTAKPTEAERQTVPHHMIDIAAPEEPYSCGQFTEEVHRILADLQKRGVTPILCGGTGLYTDNILFDTAFSPAPADPDYRKELEKLDSETLFARLQSVDPEDAAKNHPNNRKRLIRSLEIFHGTGKPKSYWDGLSRKKTSRYRPLRLCLTGERELLYRRIDDRVDQMIRKGLVEEVRALQPVLSDPVSTAAQAIGYKELSAYLRGECSLEQAADRLKQVTRNYAKRQLTWLRREDGSEEFPKYFLDITGKDENALFEEAMGYIRPFLADPS